MANNRSAAHALVTRFGLVRFSVNFFPVRVGPHPHALVTRFGASLRSAPCGVNFLYFACVPL
jgi:hypothetical protein